MKQIVQELNSDRVALMDVPAPRAEAGQVLISTRRTLISPGTERMLVSFGRSSLFEKVRKHPDKVRMVLDKMKTDGVLSTIDAVRSKLDETVELGYSNVGMVLEVGHGVRDIKAGDRVVSNGPHASVVSVPANLCAKVPDEVTDDAAAFTVLASIGLQGLRLAQPTFGECFAVIGLGLVGLLSTQLLRANGCRVIGFDYSSDRLQLAKSFGAKTVDLGHTSDPVLAAMTYSRGLGVDGVLIAAATDSNDPVHQAARMCRKRGRIVLVGVTGLQLSRADFFEKELTFQVSCSYGPGRYDPDYEDKGHDYPVGFVRWTERRNFEAVVQALAERRIDPLPLISHRFAIEQASEAYDLITSNQPSLGVLLEYAPAAAPPEAVSSSRAHSPPTGVAVGLIGPGSHARRMLLPALRDAGAQCVAVASHGGVAAADAARKHGFRHAFTNPSDLLSHPELNTVVIATRHDSHASLASAALRAGKNVYVEKPLALSLEQLREVSEALAGAPGTPRLMVGFNRRFSPLAKRMHSLLAGRAGPLAAIATINAGFVPSDHWTQDPEAGGGRIIGEACHFIDFLRFLVGHPIVSISATPLGQTHSRTSIDSATLVLRFSDESVGTIHYLANGHRTFPKERIEVFSDGRVIQLDNFRVLRGFGVRGFQRASLWRQDKGHSAAMAAFVSSIAGGLGAPIPAEEILEVSRFSIEAARQL